MLVGARNHESVDAALSHFAPQRAHPRRAIRSVALFVESLEWLFMRGG